MHLLKQIQEEVFADAYAGINAFGAGADRFTSAVNEKMEQLGTGRFRSQENGVRETNGPPADVSGQKENTAKIGGERFSLMEFEQDGRRFVQIDQEQDRFVGKSINEYPRIAKDIIDEKFNGRIIGIDNRMFVNGSGRDEYSNPSKRIPDDLYEAKMRAAGELDNLLDAGTNFRNEPDGADGHYHSDVIGGFDYFDTLFKIANRWFEAVINIKNVKRGKLFKDVTKIKDVTQDIMSSYGNNPKSQFLRTSSINNIRNESKNVKPESNSNGNLSDEEFQNRYGLKLPTLEEAEDSTNSQTFGEKPGGKKPRERFSVDDEADVAEGQEHVEADPSADAQGEEFARLQSEM